jgi:hypothetical protein
MAKGARLAYIGGGLIVIVLAGGGIYRHFHGLAATQRIVTIMPGPNIANQCAAQVPWQGGIAGDTVQFTAGAPGTNYNVTFQTSPFTDGTTAINNIQNGVTSTAHTLLDPSAICSATYGTCYYPYTITVVGGASCNSNPAPPFNSDGVIVKPAA